MALIRGVNGLCPCPICLVPKGQLSDINTTWQRRDLAETQNLVTQANEKDTVAIENLKQQGLRPIVNAFWEIRFSDPFKALSWDRMHNYAHGLGGKHIWPVLKQYISAMGRSKAALVDDQ
jgi:hypothetical protein